MDGPVKEEERLYPLDILRGIAVLGILLVNIREFSLPPHYAEAWKADPNTLNFWVRNTILILIEGKMRALFSLVFGAGKLLFTYQKKHSTPLFYRRMLVLLLIGLVDAHLFLWVNDMLFMYSICGMLVYLFRNIKPIYLSLGVPLLVIVGFISNSLFMLNAKDTRRAYLDALHVQSKGEVLRADHIRALEKWRNIEVHLIPNEADSRMKTQKYKGTYAEVASHVRKQAFKQESSFLLYTLPDPVAFMLLGMALFKWGYFTSWSNLRHRKVLYWGLILGLPLAIFNAVYAHHFFPNYDSMLRFLETRGVNWTYLSYELQRICLTLALVSGFYLLYRQRSLTLTLPLLQNIGRLSLSNYLGQSLICAAVFYGFGLNFYNEWKYGEVLLFVPLVWLFQIIFSTLWLHHFLAGPAEWLWRCLTYGKILAIRRKSR
jgi:uncharacterized protein